MKVIFKKNFDKISTLKIFKSIYILQEIWPSATNFSTMNIISSLKMILEDEIWVCYENLCLKF